MTYLQTNLISIRLTFCRNHQHLTTTDLSHNLYRRFISTTADSQTIKYLHIKVVKLTHHSEPRTTANASLRYAWGGTYKKLLADRSSLMDGSPEGIVGPTPVARCPSGAPTAQAVRGSPQLAPVQPANRQSPIGASYQYLNYSSLTNKLPTTN